MNLDEVQTFKDLEELFYHCRESKLFLNENLSLVLNSVVPTINKRGIFCLNRNGIHVTDEIFIKANKELVRSKIDKIIMIENILYKTSFCIIKNHVIFTGRIVLKLDPI